MRTTIASDLSADSFGGVARHAVTGRRTTMKVARSVKLGRATKDDYFEYAILWNRRLFMPLGVWPSDKNASRAERIAGIIRLIISIWIISLFEFPQYLYLSSNPGLQVYLQIIAPHVFFLLGSIKFIVLVLNGKKIGYCIDCIHDDWANVRLKTDRATMLLHGKFGRYMTVCCVSFMYLGIVSYTIIFPFIRIDSTATRINDRPPLPYSAIYIFFDEQSTPVYEITWVIQFVGMSYMCILNCGSYALTGVLVAHACGQLRIIGSRLDDLVDGHRREFPTVDQRLAGIVKHHLRVIRYIKYINQSLQVFFLTDELGALTVICFTGYLLLTTWSENSALGSTIFLILIIALTFNFFVISIVGQRLQDESEAVGIAASRVQWYRLSPRVARSLVVCMARSARPLKLSACNMFDMSLANFRDVMKGSIVFLNMVRKVAEVE